MGKLIKIGLIVVVIIMVLLGGMLFFGTRGLESGQDLVINEINLQEIEDGIYNGVYKAGRWSNEVKVEIKDHRIANIEIVDDIMFSQPEVRSSVFNSVIERQNLDIDIISEATVTSKAYLKSIEIALTN
jgi:uncharacterized protein with FMN-binding domain